MVMRKLALFVDWIRIEAALAIALIISVAWLGALAFADGLGGETIIVVDHDAPPSGCVVASGGRLCPRPAAGLLLGRPKT
jgi:hypothetical protein